MFPITDSNKSKHQEGRLSKILVCVYDRTTRQYHIIDYPIRNRKTLDDIVDGNSLEALNNRFSLIIDGCPVAWPDTDVVLVEQFIHEFIHAHTEVNTGYNEEDIPSVPL